MPEVFEALPDSCRGKAAQREVWKVIPDEAVKAAARIVALGNGWLAEDWDEKRIPAKYRQRDFETARAALEAAAPFMAAQALRDAVDAFPLETITAPDNAVVWLMRRAEHLGG